MALSIKTKEADTLARELARVTGESMTQAVTIALRERLARERASREPGLADRLMAFAEEVGPEFDPKPITKEEWDRASGDED